MRTEDLSPTLEDEAVDAGTKVLAKALYDSLLHSGASADEALTEAAAYQKRERRAWAEAKAADEGR